MTRKVCVVTASRAEFGVLRPLLELIFNDECLDLQLIVTGAHLSKEFGYTKTEIINANIPIAKSIEMLLSSDTPVGICKSMGLASIGFSEAYAELSPDIVLVIGDRYELIPIVSSAVMSRIPVAHLSGGEVTEGSIDDMIRHAITKLASLHFTSIDSYARRVIQMGEMPERVFNVGEVGLDNINNFELLSKTQIEDLLGFSFLNKNVLITYHPETSKNTELSTYNFSELLKSLSHFDDIMFIFTKSNSEVGGGDINKIIDNYVRNNQNAVVFDSLGRSLYLSCLTIVDAMIGNSSSGIIEAPSFKLPVVNVGDRQKGRVRAPNVLDVDAQEDLLVNAIRYALSSSFRCGLQNISNPYGDGSASANIVEILKSIELDSLYPKVFHDVLA